MADNYMDNIQMGKDEGAESFALHDLEAREKIEELDGLIAEAKELIDTLQTTQDRMQSTIASAQASITDNTTAITQINNDLSSISSGSGTRNEENISSNNFSARWSKYGRVCVISICVNPLSDLTGSSNAEIASDFPKATRGTQFTVCNNYNAVNLLVTPDGTITTYYSATLTSGHEWRGGCAYITAE